MNKLLAAALVGVTVVALLPASPAAAAVTYQDVVDITFPADPRVRFTDTFDACRSGCARHHQATDLMGDRMWKLYSAADGLVCGIDEGEEDSYGRYITICGDDGYRYRYLHLNNDTPGTDDGAASLEHVYAPGIRKGLRVARGQFIAYLGDSGNAEDTAPHLHFDVFDDAIVNPYGETRMNPYPSLIAALQRGDIADGSAFYAEPADRAAGADRIETALALAATRFEAATTAVLAPAHTPGEAIVAGPLSAAADAPVLVTPREALDDRVAARLTELGVTDVYLVGDVLSGDAASALTDLGIEAEHVTRLGSADLFETAAAVAEAVWSLHGAGDPLEGSIEGEVAHAHEHTEPVAQLVVTDQADRSGAVLLDGATVGGQVAIGLDVPDPGDITRVAFHVDGAAEPVHTELRDPYDLAGGADDIANLVPTADLGVGEHTVRAVLTLTDGSTDEVVASFTVADDAGVSGEPLPATSSPPRLDVSAFADRSEALLLDGARVSGDVHVHVTGPDPADVERVLWWVDDPEMTGAADREESRHPWDLAGSRNDGSARPLDTTELDNGTHDVTALVRFHDGSTGTVTASFGVHNVAARRAIVALGEHEDPTRSWPDSLMAGYYGSLTDQPVLLVLPGELPATTATALTGVGQVTIIGGRVAVADEIQTAIDEVAGTVGRLWGDDRYATAVAVVEDLRADRLVDRTRVWATTGRNWPDAATAGPIVAWHGEVLVLVDGQGLGADGATRSWLTEQANRIDEGRAIGGPAAITEEALTSFRLAIT
ncbi:MAG TPA: cell wall-binding repeat-containing protein [Nitriliruptorales bacterium]